jgi:GT2 family glycosyltransferase
MALPTISVLLPTTGGGKLKQIVDVYTADATVGQIVIMVDNPGLDIQKLQLGPDSRIEIVQNEKQVGLTRSLNIGLQKCTGDIVLRNDDDDIPMPNRARIIAEYMASMPDCELVFSFAKGTDLDSGASWDISGPTNDTEIKAKLASHNFIVHSTLAFRRNIIIQKLNGYDESFYYAQDYDLYLRAIRAGLRFSGIPQVLMTRVYHQASITVARRKRQILYSFAARLIHHAALEEQPRPWQTIWQYGKLLLIPNQLRAFKRRLGYGR